MTASLSIDQVRGSLLGGAVGDALGAAVEFQSLAEIRSRFGPAGILDYAPAFGRLGAITDDTQMTLFTAEGSPCRPTDKPAIAVGLIVDSICISGKTRTRLAVNIPAVRELSDLGDPTGHVEGVLGHGQRPVDDFL